MSAPQLLLLAVAAMTGLAVLRWARVQAGRTPYPDRRVPFFIAFVALPPIALGLLLRPGGDPFRGVGSVLPYAAVIAGLAMVMWLAARIVRLLPLGGPRSALLVALIGSEGHPDDPRFDPPLTAKLAESMAAVDKTNQVFPRGYEFPVQIDRPGFRGAWDALDSATARLEVGIAEAERHGATVASSATAMADDARGRLDTLRSLAVEAGQAWASGTAQPALR